MDERPDAAPGSDQRKAALAHRLGLVALGLESGARAVEAAVAKDDAVGVRHRRLQVTDGLERALRLPGRPRVERVVLALHASAGSCVWPAGIALRHKAIYASQQVVGALA